MLDYLTPVPQLLHALSTSPTGLSSRLAREKREKHGPNRLPRGRKKSLLRRILAQLLDPMVLILLASALISAFLGGEEGRADVIVILIVVLLNTVLGVVQEQKAEAALEALGKLTPLSCRVMRDGEVRILPAEELVPGDVLLLQAGDAVPADGRVIESACLRVEAAALTGETGAVEKNTEPLAAPAPPSERHCALFLGSTVIGGRGKMVVSRIGSDTEMGRIASHLSTEEEPTPLQKRLSRLSFTLTLLVLAVCALTFAVGWWKEGEWSAAAALRSFLLAVSLAVAAIPEGMVAVVTVVLSMGVCRMAARGAIVRKLTAVETLGCTSVICSDKTGTLTRNRMEVTAHFGSHPFLPTAFALCGDAEALGDPTELALLAFAKQSGVRDEDLRAYRRVGEIPFDSARKRMTTYHESDRGLIRLTKGAPDVILPRCVGYSPAPDRVLPMTEGLRQEMDRINRRYAASALRVIAIAYHMPSSLPASPDPERDEGDLILLGLAGMTDPPRPEVKQALALCSDAGVEVVMITGDHPETARAIAAELGLMRQGDAILTGQELEAMDDDALARALPHVRVFARVQPDHKMRIVRAYRSLGMITAMTGDGVNDAPALKHSDIGIGMGQSGTDVTKGCADLILSDDNFATIVAAVEEGRRIWDNVCKAIHFLLSSNLSEVITVFTATLCGVEVLRPIHLLFINLITDSLPALALGMEAAEEGTMSRPPRPSSEGLFPRRTVLRLVLQGLAAAILTGAAFLIGCYLERSGPILTVALRGSALGRTMAFLTMAMAETLHAVHMRTRHTPRPAPGSRNPLLTLSILLSIALTAALIYLPPLSELFSLEQIPFPFYLLSLALAALMLPIARLIAFVAADRKSK